MQADNRHSYGENRYQLMGKIEQRLFVVVYTPRHELSVLSRPAKPINES
ncbi:BrnT family toxin [Methylomonas paludis]|uniref:BrnT family toxin n=1 Tax=Methylomonas paludis TaxID=1173101 RepID=A0A975MLB9_9GAMM|nr:BrnT family toxin [Methylomonas paludis]